MAEQKIRFDDGAGYEQMMGVWSRLAGDIFLDWLAPRPGLRWIDIGCGNGAFTELLVERCVPAEVQGIDPSEGQLAFARTRPGARLAKFQQGDAMALSYADRTFDIAVMALVLFYVPDVKRGVAEMRRVVRPGGTVAAYMWDMLGGGSPTEPMQALMREHGQSVARPPSSEASRMPVLTGLWNDAGLADVETREITVQRTFDDFDDFLSATLLSPNVGAAFNKLTPAQAEEMRSKLRQRMPADAAGRITYGARANAIKGRAPG